jgi:hypothetical protein
MGKGAPALDLGNVIARYARLRDHVEACDVCLAELTLAAAFGTMPELCSTGERRLRDLLHSLWPAEHDVQNRTHRVQPCPDCDGSGHAAEYGEEGWCIRCDGRGRIGSA